MLRQYRGQRREVQHATPTISWAQKDLLSEEQLEEVKAEYPEDSLEVAIQKYVRKHSIQGIFFLDEDGNRCVYQDDVRYFHRHHWPQRPKQIRIDTRHYLVYKKEPSLMQIDSPKPAYLHALVAHNSERGWFLPRTHKRHLLNFPREILDYIFELALTAPDSAFIQPSTAKSNWKTESRSPCYSLRYSPWIISNTGGVGGGNDLYVGNHEGREGRMVPMISRCRKYDNNGRYVELRKITRAIIDATFLRASKEIYKIGDRILYGKQPFIFTMTQPSGHGSPPTALRCSEFEPLGVSSRAPKQLSLDKKFFVHQPWAYKQFSTIDINLAILHIQQRASIIDLQGWAYHDTFLRFLHTIGPKNCAKIKTIKINGVVQIHDCSNSVCKKCPDGLVQSLSIYIPIIKEVCSSLESLAIYAEKDRTYEWDSTHEGFEELENWEQNLLPILENDIRGIPSLKHLEVYCNGSDGEETQIAEVALPTIEFLRERNAQALRDASREDAKARSKRRMVTTQEVQCEFCGEGHVWAECHNLCNFCGSFGHFRTECTKRSVLFWEFQEPH